MNPLRCTSCGAPLDPLLNQCQYCGTCYEPNVEVIRGDPFSAKVVGHAVIDCEPSKPKPSFWDALFLLSRNCYMNLEQWAKDFE